MADPKTTHALRPREQARALGISERLLWQWTKDRVIPHLRVGRTVLYPQIEVQAWLSRQAAQSPSA